MIIQKLIFRIRQIKEPLIVWGLMAVIFLPVRFLFVHFIGNNWIGSFGLPTGFAVLIIYLIKKEKLGWFGKMVVREVTKRLKKGKIRYMIYLETIFLVSISVFMLYSIHYGDSLSEDQTSLIKKMFNNILSLEYDPSVRSIPLWQWHLEEPALILSISIHNFDTIAKLISNINIHFNGWLLTLYTISLFEQLEAFGVTQLYRRTLAQ